MRYLFHSSKGSVAFLTAWSIYSLMIYFDRENQIEAWLEKTNQKRPKRGSGPQEGCFIFFPASPLCSSTSTLCLLVVTVTGTEGEPGERGGEGRESGR